jgi:hypothetical protein
VQRAVGYRTAAVSDWCGADLGKLTLASTSPPARGPENLKYLIRQGLDIRLFLSLFYQPRRPPFAARNHYLGGVP